MNPSTDHLSVTAFLSPVQALTALWWRTGRGLLLSHEIELDRGIGMSETAWEQVRGAALEGRVADVPVARETLSAWKFENVLVDGALDECADLLPSALVAVEFVWGGCSPTAHPKRRFARRFDVAMGRREQILADYRPPASDVPSPWHEVHQGCARSDAMARRRVLQLVDRALCRSPNRWALACVDLDHAAQFEAEGKYQSARESLDTAVRGTWSFRNADRREPAAVALAEHLWRCGEMDDATRLLSQLRGDPAHALSRRIEDRAPERVALADADQAHRERSGVESWSVLAFAHLSAGHRLVAERMARELSLEHPDDPRSWETKARVLHANARFRSTLDAADRWTDLAPDSRSGAFASRASVRSGGARRAPARRRNRRRGHRALRSGAGAAGLRARAARRNLLPGRARRLRSARRRPGVGPPSGTRAGPRMARRSGHSTLPRPVGRGRAQVARTPCRA